MIYKYLMDSNVIATSKVIKIISTDFFKQSCIVVDEIAFELSDLKLAAMLKSQALLPSSRTLGKLKIITDDLVKLGILKTDHGNGEALLLAEALLILEGEHSQTALSFMKVEPVIVTDEKAVDAYAKSIGLKAINGKEFIAIVEAAVY